MRRPGELTKEQKQKQLDKDIQQLFKDYNKTKSQNRKTYIMNRIQKLDEKRRNLTKR